MNSKIYVIIGCIILILISVFVIILVLINHNSKPKYIALKNPSNKIQSCFTYDNTGDNEDLTKSLCDIDDDCKGYYILSEPTEDYPNFVHFNSSPVSNPPDQEDYCYSGGGNDKYTTYKSKVDNYTTPYNNPFTGICYVNVPLYIQKGVDGEDIIQKMCDKITDCNGYYKHSTKPYYVASTSKKLPDNFTINNCYDYDSGSDEDFDTSNFPIFMKKNT